MGKVTGFLEYTREAARRAGRSPSASTTGSRSTRIFPKTKLRTQGARCMDCGVPFCHTGCPLNNIIPDWNDLVYRGPLARSDPRAALHQQFSGVHRPHLSRALRSGLRAGHQRAAGDDQGDREDHRRARLSKKAGFSPSRRCARTGKRVAVVGSGPAGLAAAQQLNRAGHTRDGL